MLSNINLNKTIGKEEYKKLHCSLEERLSKLQRSARDAGLPIIVLFEGWDTAGKGVLMNELIAPLDPRGFHVHNVSTRTETELLWPSLHRFWNLIPATGRLSIFNRSWYRDAINSFDQGNLEDILAFERQLVDGGYLIIKFFLHISKKEQGIRLKKLDENKSSSWRVSKREWDNHNRYDERAIVVEEVITRTNKEYAPWIIVEAENKKFATIKILSTVAQAIEKKLQQIATQKDISATLSTVNDEEGEPKQENSLSSFESTLLTPSILKNMNLLKTISDKKYNKQLDSLQKEFRELQYQLYSVRRPMVIVLEGQDAAGKGGCIKRLTQRLDPRGYQVTPTAAPNDWERAHHYMWRFWTTFPKAGHVAIYDRSWYGRVLVERVEGFCSELDWRRAYEEINETEDQWARYGTIILKFWLQIDSEEQLSRFKERELNPTKSWKITTEDWRNREKAPLYEIAAEDMLLQTSTANAPWVVVEANNKRYARVKVLQNVVDTLKNALK